MKASKREKNIKPKELMQRYYALASNVSNNRIKEIKREEIGKSYLGQSIYGYKVEMKEIEFKKILKKVHCEFKKETEEKKKTNTSKIKKARKKGEKNKNSNVGKKKKTSKIIKAENTISLPKIRVKRNRVEEVKVLIHGAIHAREGMSGAILIRLIDKLHQSILKERRRVIQRIEYVIYNKMIYNYKTKPYRTARFERTESSRYVHLNTYNGKYVNLYIIPIVNPDGVYLCTNRPEMHNVFCNNHRFLNYLYIFSKYDKSANFYKNNQFSSKFGVKKGIKLHKFSKNKKFNYFKANLCFVDLNVNFPEKFGMGKSNVFHEAPSNFIGYFPLSQSEIISLKRKTDSFLPDLTFSFHNAGNEVYFGYEDRFAFSPITEVVSTALGFDAFPTPDSFGGYKEWFISTYDKPSFTIEFGSENTYKSSNSCNYLRIFEEIPLYLPSVVQMLYSVCKML